MRVSRAAGITITVLIIAAVVGVNMWASDQANKVTPIEVAAIATVGTVDGETNKRYHHLDDARNGFYLLRAWHWWRFKSLSES